MILVLVAKELAEAKVAIKSQDLLAVFEYILKIQSSNGPFAWHFADFFIHFFGQIHGIQGCDQGGMHRPAL